MRFKFTYGKYWHKFYKSSLIESQEIVKVSIELVLVTLLIVLAVLARFWFLSDAWYADDSLFKILGHFIALITTIYKFGMMIPVL